jgi:hypothetical protein
MSGARSGLWQAVTVHIDQLEAEGAELLDDAVEMCLVDDWPRHNRHVAVRCQFHPHEGDLQVRAEAPDEADGIDRRETTSEGSEQLHLGIVSACDRYRLTLTGWFPVYVEFVESV